MSKKRGRRKDKSGFEQQKKGSGSHLRTYSFVITFALITVVIVSSWLGSIPQVEHIPPDFKFNSQPWMSIVPRGIHYVGYTDFRKITTISQNATFFGQVGLVNLYQLNYSILPEAVAYEVDIQLLDVNTAVTVLKLQQSTQNDLAGMVSRATKAPSWTYAQFVIHGLLMRTPDQQRLVLGYISVTNDYVVISLDEKTGRQQVETILGQMAYTVPSLFDNLTVQRAVYATGGADGSYAALFVGMFSSQLTGSEMIVKSVMSGSGGANTIVVTRSVLFPSQDLASAQYEQAHTVYRDANSYRILDSWLVITYQYTTVRLRSEITGI